MTIDERVALADQRRKSGYNCCQAVAAAFCDLVELDEPQLVQLASGFGAGMGCMEGTCGALCGAVMIAGLLKKGKRTPAASRAILQDFQQRCGATICKDLKGVETGKVLCPCADCVRNAVRAAGKVLL